MKKAIKIVGFIVLLIVYINIMKDEPTPAERYNALYNIYDEQAKDFVFSDL